MFPLGQYGRIIEHTVALLLILGVSLFDTWLIVKHASILHSTEQNPIGCFLLDVANGNVGLFVRTKLVGTSIVVAILIHLFISFQTLSAPVTRCVTLFQLWLLWYLCFATSTMWFLDLAWVMLLIACAIICISPYLSTKIQTRATRRQTRRRGSSITSMYHQAR